MGATVSTLKTDVRTLDLDKAIKETEPLSVKYRGKEYPLPPAISSKVILKHVGKLNSQGGIPLESLYDFLKDLIGEEVLDQLLEDGLPYQGLEELLKWMLAEYGIVTESLEGDTQAPLTE